MIVYGDDFAISRDGLALFVVAELRHGQYALRASPRLTMAILAPEAFADTITATDFILAIEIYRRRARRHEPHEAVAQRRHGRDAAALCSQPGYAASINDSIIFYRRRIPCLALLL